MGGVEVEPVDGPPARVAIACQGGGTHTAFTAGVLRGILANGRQRDFEIVALSGTSGGAICALLAWSGLVLDGPEDGAKRLAEFWVDNEARTWWDWLLNRWGQYLLALGNYVALPEVSPYRLGPMRSLLPEPFSSALAAEARLRELLTRHVPFDRFASRRTRTPRLLIGAVDVAQGTFKVFKSDAEPSEIGVDAVLASAALPTLFRAMPVDDGFSVHQYWDGLFSQNPPIRDITAGLQRDAKPDEIWVIQINPQMGEPEPREIAEIADRRNELSGNLSLNQEIDSLKNINKYLRRGQLTATSRTGPLHKKPIAICRIDMPLDLSRRLDAPSKLDRDPGFIRELLERGEARALDFLARRRTGRVRFERYPVEPCPPALSALKANWARYEDRVLDEWKELRARFDAAATDAERRQAVKDAHRLLGGLMYWRGYPVADFRQRRRDIELEHPDVARRYWLVHRVATSRAASGTRLGVAMSSDDVLLPELLGFAAYPTAEGQGGGTRQQDRATFRPDATRSRLMYQLSGPQLAGAVAWSIRLGSADEARPGAPVMLQGTPRPVGVLTREDLEGPPAARTARRFAMVLEALEAGNTYLEVATAGGVMRGQIR